MQRSQFFLCQLFSCFEDNFLVRSRPRCSHISLIFILCSLFPCGVFKASQARSQSCAPPGQCGLMQRDGCTVRSAELTDRTPCPRRASSGFPSTQEEAAHQLNEGALFRGKPFILQRRHLENVGRNALCCAQNTRRSFTD